jgi:hypothetical protein
MRPALLCRKKTFRQKRPDPYHPGKWIWNTSGCPTLIYRLAEVTEAVAANYSVLVVEGEAKADLLWSWNVASTTNAGGAKKWTSVHSEFLKDADVILVPDHDEAGWQHINQVGTSLVGIAARIRVLMLPDLKPKDDVIDWAKRGGTREQLDALIEQAQDWKPPTEEEISEQKAEARKKEDELIEALAKIDPGDRIEYAKERKKAAEQLEVRPSDIDQAVRARRDQGPLFGHWIVEPWPEPCDGDSLLRDLIRHYRRHVICSHEASLTIALWTIFSWIHDEIAVHSPILLVTSPVRRRCLVSCRFSHLVQLLRSISAKRRSIEQYSYGRRPLSLTNLTPCLLLKTKAKPN